MDTPQYEQTAETPGTNLRPDRQMLMIMHLSQLLNLVTGLGGIVVPIILWQLKKDEIQEMDEQGKEVVNFQISMFIYYAVSIVLCLVFIGFILLGVLALINIIFPIIQGLNAKDGKPVKYPLTIRLLK